MVIWCTTKTRDMTPIGKYIVIQKINEEKKTKSGLLLSSEDVESFRYQKGQVVKPGTDVSVINELPPGRKEIKTYHQFDSNRLKVYKFIKEEIKSGAQIYIVYPLIQESEKMDYKDLMDGYESISRYFPQPEFQISVVHGKMKSPDKEYEMNRFLKGETNIMVATTVIEVGVNITNASVMIIESSERFGLSQLHQLRGRVGRGNKQSYCVLMSNNKLNEDAKKRLKTMTETNDGLISFSFIIFQFYF